MASEEAEVKLLGATVSPFALRVRIALNVKKIGYEVLEQDIINKSQLLLKSNPIYKKIPVLLHHGRPICESLVILQYLDDTWQASEGPSILPSHPRDRATARFWAAFIDDKLFPYLFGFAAAQTEEEKAAALGGILEVVQVLEDVFEKCNMEKKANYFSGETIGYLDIALGCFLGWIKAIEKMLGKKILDEGKTPLLVGWAKRFCSDVAVKEVMPEPDLLIDFAKMRFRANPDPLTTPP